MTRGPDRDRGTVLVITLILVVVLAVVVVAMARFSAVGLRASETTDDRSETNADGAAVVTWAMEQLRTGALTAASCDGVTDLAPAAPINVNGSTVTLICSTSASSGSFPVVTLEATASKGTAARRVQAVAQYASGVAVRALDWSVDDVPLGP